MNAEMLSFQNVLTGHCKFMLDDLLTAEFSVMLCSSSQGSYSGSQRVNRLLKQFLGNYLVKVNCRPMRSLTHYKCHQAGPTMAK